MDVINTVPISIPCDESLSWQDAQPNPFDVMAARGIVLNCDSSTKGYWSVVSKILPELFPTPEAARKAVKRTNAYNRYLLENDRLSGFVLDEIKLKSMSRGKVPVLINFAVCGLN